MPRTLEDLKLRPNERAREFRHTVEERLKMELKETDGASGASKNGQQNGPQRTQQQRRFVVSVSVIAVPSLAMPSC
jgi:hypothetical protein